MIVSAMTAPARGLKRLVLVVIISALAAPARGLKRLTRVVWEPTTPSSRGVYSGLYD
jgi:hypothetical protein